MPGFKKRGFHFTTKGFNENAFKIEDVFHDKTIEKLKNQNNYLIREISSMFTGRCFTVCYLHNVMFELHTFYLKQSWDIKTYVHTQGEEYWLNFGNFPTERCDKILDTNNSDGVVNALMGLAEIEKTDLNQEKFSCQSYLESENFVDSCKLNVCKKIRPNLNCTIASFKELCGKESNLVDLKECEEEESAWNAYQVFNNITDELFNSPWTLGCPLPCRQITYTIDLGYSHANTEAVREADEKAHLSSNGIFKLHIYYKTLNVEERKENLVYDAGSFFAAAGGNLGLFLGFSCLSAVFALISYTEKWIG